MPGWLIGLIPESVSLKRTYFSSSASLGRWRSTIRNAVVSIGSTVSLRCAISWSESRITGVWYSSATLKASTVIAKVSATEVGASTGRTTSPCAEKQAWKRSDCSLFVGMPVEGPPRCTFTQTSGSSAIEASPSISVLSDMPGPEVAVSTFLPAKEAPTQAPMPAISSSAWIIVPPYFQISRARKCMISDEGVIG